VARQHAGVVEGSRSIFVATTAALLSAASLAIAEPPAGTKNFNAPDAAPNYFSNESGPVMHQAAPLPAAPQAPAPMSRETEEPEGQVEAAAANAERQVVRTAKGRERDRTAHAQSRTAGRLKEHRCRRPECQTGAGRIATCTFAMRATAHAPPSRPLCLRRQLTLHLQPD
jgi:hypothetical protein